VVLAGHPGLVDCVKKDGVLVDVDQRKVVDLVATSHDCDLADALFPRSAAVPSFVISTMCRPGPREHAAWRNRGSSSSLRIDCSDRCPKS
jgi:hypothetical protein